MECQTSRLQDQVAELQERLAAARRESERLRGYLDTADEALMLLGCLKVAFAGVDLGTGRFDNPHRHELHLTLDQGKALRAALGDSR